MKELGKNIEHKCDPAFDGGKEKLCLGGLNYHLVHCNLT